MQTFGSQKLRLQPRKVGLHLGRSGGWYLWFRSGYHWFRGVRWCFGLLALGRVAKFRLSGLLVRFLDVAGRVTESLSILPRCGCKRRINRVADFVHFLVGGQRHRVTAKMPEHFVPVDRSLG